MEDDNKNKYDFLIYLLGEGDAMVCLDARHPDVDVPKIHKDNSTLNLVFNLNFKRPFEVQPEAIFATLAFGGRPHKCVIPFDAVWAMYEPTMKKGQVWENSIPEDINLADQILMKDKGIQEKPKSTPKSAKTSSRTGKKTGTKRDRSHLRVIK